MPTDPEPTDPEPTDPDPTDPEALLDVWASCLPDQRERGAAVIARYAEPQRRYHDTRHLASVLGWIDRLAGDHDLFLVRLAAFFHDAVYAIPPGQVSNEEASARLALRELSRAGLEQEGLNEVARLVRLTGTHAPGPRDPEGELLCDADLAVLAGTPEEYATYVADVTAEYAYLPREVFAAGRLDVLTQLSERELFRTAKGRSLNERARTNLEAERRSLAEELGVPVESSGP
jgi:predicted metal-dependent HD superfamily phosphohydrolase